MPYFYPSGKKIRWSSVESQKAKEKLSMKLSQGGGLTPFLGMDLDLFRLNILTNLSNHNSVLFKFAKKGLKKHCLARIWVSIKKPNLLSSLSDNLTGKSAPFINWNILRTKRFCVWMFDFLTPSWNVTKKILFWGGCIYHWDDCLIMEWEKFMFLWAGDTLHPKLCRRLHSYRSHKRDMENLWKWPKSYRCVSGRMSIPTIVS